MMLLAGIGVAFAWVLLSFTFGLSATQAHAADDDALLDSVASSVAGTTSTVTDVIDDGTSAAVTIVAPVTESVAPADETVASVIEPAVDAAPVVNVVQSTVATVADLPADGVLTPIADIALSVVARVPVVGDAVSALGADDAVAAVGTSVDGLLAGTTTVVGGTVTELIDTAGGVVAEPAVLPLPGLNGTPGVSTAVAVPTAAVGPLELLTRAAYLTGAAAWNAIASDASAALSPSDGAFASGMATGGILGLLRSVMQADSVLIGPGGSGPGAWVLVALGFVVAYRAWVRRTGLENDVAPPAPLLATDVSPD